MTIQFSTPLLIPDAEATTNRLNSDPDDNWTYRVKVTSAEAGTAVIETFDESGELVGNL